MAALAVAVSAKPEHYVYHGPPAPLGKEKKNKFAKNFTKILKISKFIITHDFQFKQITREKS